MSSRRTELTLCHSRPPRLGVRSTHLTKGATWGYGILSITVISSISLSIAMLILLMPPKGKLMKIAMSSILSFGTGILIGDAIFHLMPSFFASEQDESASTGNQQKLEYHSEVIWRGCVVCCGIYLFFLIEKLLHSFAGHSHPAHATHAHVVHNGLACGHRDAGTKDLEFPQDHGSLVINDKVVFDGVKCEHYPHQISRMPCRQQRDDLKEYEISSLSEPMGTSQSICDSNENSKIHTSPPCHQSSHHCHSNQDRELSISESWQEINVSSYDFESKRVKPMGWLIIFGDSLHNFIDGLAIAVSFSEETFLGLSTSIAILFHEIPHELADFAILLTSGMSKKKIILYNLLSTFVAFLGLIIGMTASNIPQFQIYVFALTSAAFLYIALANLVPELVHAQHRPLFIIIESVCMLLGFALMLLIALYGENIIS